MYTIMCLLTVQPPHKDIYVTSRLYVSSLPREVITARSLLKVASRVTSLDGASRYRNVQKNRNARNTILKCKYILYFRLHYLYI